MRERAIYYIPEPPTPVIDTYIPQAFLTGLSADQTLLIESIAAQDAQSWSGIQIRGDTAMGLRLTYDTTVVGTDGESQTYRVAAFIITEGNTQRMQRFTVTHADSNDSVTVPLPPQQLTIPRIGINARIPRLPASADPLSVHALSTHDRRALQLQDVRTVSFITANPESGYDMHATITLRPEQQGARVHCVALEPLPEDTRQWLRGRDNQGPDLPESVAAKLEQAMLRPNQNPARHGVSRRHNDPYVSFSGPIQVAGNGPSSELQEWDFRADFVRSSNTWELAVLQYRRGDEIMRTTWRPDYGDFTNPRAPRNRDIGSPPSSTAESVVSEAQRSSRSRPLDDAELDPRPTRRARREGQVQAIGDIRALPLPSDPQTHLISQDQYRALLGSGAQYGRAGVCGPIAAGAAMGVGVHFDHVRAVSGTPTQGMDGAQTALLLGRFGITPSVIPYPPFSNWTVDAVGRDLQARMDRGEFNNAVIIFRGGEDTNSLQDHHVAIWKANGQWIMYDGIGEPPLMALPDQPGTWLAQALFGAGPVENLREMDVLGFTLPSNFQRQSHANEWALFLRRQPLTSAPQHSGVFAWQPPQIEVLNPPAHAQGTMYPQVHLDPFTSGLGPRMWSNATRRETFEHGGLFDSWRQQSDQQSSHILQEAALACRPFVQTRNRRPLDEQMHIHAFDDIPFNATSVNLILRFADSTLRQVVDVFRVTPSHPESGLLAIMRGYMRM